MGISNNYINEIKKILKNARQKAYTAVNSAMVEAYWEIGRRIVEEEQSGRERAEYGKEIIKNLSKELTEEFGKGFGERNIRNIRQFYVLFSDYEKWKSLISKLTWTHIQKVLRVSDEKARIFYLTEAAENSIEYKKLLAQKIPIAFYFGDYIENGDPKILSTPIWQERLEKCKNFVKNYNDEGGNSVLFELPKEGIFGNDHFIFQNLNNDIVADHIEKWIRGL